MRNSLLGILFFLFFFGSCEKAENFSETPQIKFKDFVFDMEIKNGFEYQVGFLSFEFIDGDGDIGFAENSDSIPSKEIPDVFIYESKKTNGNFIRTDTTFFLLPYFNEGIYRKYIRGDMEIKIYLLKQVGDTMRYDFQIMDRAYHLSNLESTSDLIVPDWN